MSANILEKEKLQNPSFNRVKICPNIRTTRKKIIVLFTQCEHYKKINNSVDYPMYTLQGKSYSFNYPM